MASAWYAARLWLAVAALTGAVSPSRADVVRAAGVACTRAADADLIAHSDRAAGEIIARPLLSSHACIALPKGIKVDVDERRPPQACVRLTGDLSCYWLAASLLDEHPGEKASGGGQRGGGRHAR